MKLVTDFYNKALAELYNMYFPTVKHYMNNPNTQAITNAMELFNNGCMTYDKLVYTLSKYTCDTEYNINRILSKYIATFEGANSTFDSTTFQYKRKPTEAEIKFGNGATHYKVFPKSIYMGKNGKMKKRLKCPVDQLIYTA